MRTERFVALMDQHDFAMMKNFKSEIIDYLRYSYYVGGMPEAVETYVETKDFNSVRSVQDRLLMAYENDLSKACSGGNGDKDPHALEFDSDPACQRKQKIRLWTCERGGEGKRV